MASQKIRALVNRFYGGPPTAKDMPSPSERAVNKAKAKLWEKRNKGQAVPGSDGLLSAYIPPTDPAARKRKTQLERVLWNSIETGLRSNDPQVRKHAHARYLMRGAIERFRHIQPDDKSYLIGRIGASVDEIEAFQRLLGDEGYDLDQAMRFAISWKQAEGAGLNPKAQFDFGPEIQQRVDALFTVGQRVKFVYSEGVDFNKQQLDPRADLAAQPCGAVGNADSRTGWGNSGTADALQKAGGPDFKRRKKALHAQHANWVGNVAVGSNSILEVPAAPGSNQPKVIFNSPAPNYKKHSGLRVKLPRLNRWFRPGHVSEQQLQQLRDANRAPFDGTRYFNEGVQWHGKPPLTKASTISFGGSKYGIPVPVGARVTAEEAVRFAVEHPEVTDITVFSANAPGLHQALIKEFRRVGVKATKYGGVEKSAAAPGGVGPDRSVHSSGADSDRSSTGSGVLIPGMDASRSSDSAAESEADDESLVATSQSDMSLESPREPTPAPGIRSQGEKTRAFVQAFAPHAGNKPLTPELLDQALQGWFRSANKSGYSDRDVIDLLSTAFGNYCVETLGMKWDIRMSASGEPSFFIRGGGEGANIELTLTNFVKSGLQGLEAGFGDGGFASTYRGLRAALKA